MSTQNAQEQPEYAQSMAELSGEDGIEFAVVEGFKPGSTLRLGSLSAGDLIEFNEANEGEAKRTAGLRLICKSLVDKIGNRYASDPKNIAEFRKKNHKAVQRIVEAILELNGLTVKKTEEAKNV